MDDLRGHNRLKATGILLLLALLLGILLIVPSIRRPAAIDTPAERPAMSP
jgi:hypothetical protein